MLKAEDEPLLLRPYGSLQEDYVVWYRGRFGRDPSDRDFSRRMTYLGHYATGRHVPGLGTQRCYNVSRAQLLAQFIMKQWVDPLDSFPAAQIREALGLHTKKTADEIKQIVEHLSVDGADEAPADEAPAAQNTGYEADD